MVCYDVQVEPALQPITGQELARGTNQAPDARLDVHCRGFWQQQRAAFFHIRVCYPNADSYRDLSSKQIYRIHEKEKKRKHNCDHRDHAGVVCTTGKKKGRFVNETMRNS